MKKKLKSLKSLRDKAWKLWSIHIRSKDADWRGYVACYTCGKIKLWQEMNAGHYRHDSHDFDERNVKVQCVECNLTNKGRADLFYLHLVKEYGQETADELKDRKKWNDYSRQQLEEIINKFK